MGRTVRVSTQAQTFIISGSVVLILLLAILFSKPSAPPPAAKLLEQALAALEQSETYNLVIVETAPNYTLYFQGMVENGGTLTGLLPDFNLDVSKKDGVLHLKQYGETDWEEAGAMELQDLKSFLIGPAEILGAHKAFFNSAVSGPDASLSDAPCRTVYLKIAEGEQVVEQLFPEINRDAVDSISLGAALTEPGFTLKQLKIIVQFSNDGGRLERAYYLD